MAKEVVYELTLQNGNILAGPSLNALVAAANEEIEHRALKLDVSGASRAARGLLSRGFHKACSAAIYDLHEYRMKPGTLWVKQKGSKIPRTRPNQNVHFVVTVGSTVFYGPVLANIVKRINENRPAELAQDVTAHGLRHLASGKIKLHAGCKQLKCTRQDATEPIGNEWVRV